MSFYRTVLAAVAAVAIASPVFADDTTATTGTDTTTQQAAQANDNSNANAAQQVSTTDQATDSKIDLNKATAKDLMKIKGLSAAKAHAIIAYRKKHGDFKSVDDLTMVKGFKSLKPETLKNIENQLTIQ